MTTRTAFAVVAFCLGSLNPSAAQSPSEKPAPDATYRKVELTSPDVQAAVKFAVADQQRRDRSRSRLLSVVSAERQFVSVENFRLCLSLDRGGRTELARVVLSRNAKQRWSVTIWSWGACR